MVRNLRCFFLTCFLIFSIVLTNAALAVPVVIEHLLDDPPEYVQEIGPVMIDIASAVDIYVENILDPERWKEWYVEIWVPEMAGIDELFVDVDYHLQPDRSDDPIWIYDVELHQIPGISPWPGFEGFYASTDEAPWEEYDTTRKGSGVGYDIGNPAWVSFHFDDLPSPFIYYIHDQCIPEPATIALLGFGALALLRKRRN